VAKSLLALRREDYADFALANGETPEAALSQDNNRNWRTAGQAPSVVEWSAYGSMGPLGDFFTHPKNGWVTRVPQTGEMTWD